MGIVSAVHGLLHFRQRTGAHSLKFIMSDSLPTRGRHNYKCRRFVLIAIEKFTTAEMG